MDTELAGWRFILGEALSLFDTGGEADSGGARAVFADPSADCFGGFGGKRVPAQSRGWFNGLGRNAVILFGGCFWMDYKKEAVSDLRRYLAMKRGVENNRERMAALEAEARGVRLSLDDGVKVLGGGGHAEDRLINILAERERLRLTNRAVRPLVRAMDRAMELLSDGERNVLERFYVDRRPGYLDVLCDELGYEERQIYNIKDEALRKFTLAMYGIEAF